MYKFLKTFNVMFYVTSIFLGLIIFFECLSMSLENNYEYGKNLTSFILLPILIFLCIWSFIAIFLNFRSCFKKYDISKQICNNVSNSLLFISISLAFFIVSCVFLYFPDPYSVGWTSWIEPRSISIVTLGEAIIMLFFYFYYSIKTVVFYYKTPKDQRDDTNKTHASQNRSLRFKDLREKEKIYNLLKTFNKIYFRASVAIICALLLSNFLFLIYFWYRESTDKSYIHASNIVFGISWAGLLMLSIINTIFFFYKKTYHKLNTLLSIPWGISLVFIWLSVISLIVLWTNNHQEWKFILFTSLSWLFIFIYLLFLVKTSRIYNYLPKETVLNYITIWHKDIKTVQNRVDKKTIQNYGNNFIMTLVLCVLLWPIGGHRFYTGHIKSGLTMLMLSLLSLIFLIILMFNPYWEHQVLLLFLVFTLIFFLLDAIWALIDLITILMGRFRNANNEQILGLRNK